MTRKGYRRITCPVCGDWLFLRPVSYDYGHPQPDPMEYRLASYHSWHCDNAQATRIANAGKETLADVRAIARAESYARKESWDRDTQDRKIGQAFDILAREGVK